jgi:SAM-dependent methyltransferase
MIRDENSNLAEQYANEQNLRTRIETHRLYTVGPPLEPAVDKVLNLQPQESLLDIGTGPGDFPQRLRRAGHTGRLVGVDASPGMIAKAKSAALNIEFLQADAQSLPFPDESFDVITARHMLYHVPDIPRALREAHRLIRPGGRFLAITNILDNFGDYRRALHEATASLYGSQAADAMRVLVPACDIFNEKNGPALIENVFHNVQVNFVEASLRFETAEPALLYFDSTRTMKGLSVEQWDVFRQAFAKIVAARVASGPWLISKTVALLSATKAPTPNPKNPKQI